MWAQPQTLLVISLVPKLYRFGSDSLKSLFSAGRKMRSGNETNSIGDCLLACVNLYGFDVNFSLDYLMSVETYSICAQAQDSINCMLGDSQMAVMGG